MAELTDEGNEEPDRPTPGRGPSLAEEAGDDLPALLVIAVGIAVITVLLAGSGFDRGTTGSAPAPAGPVATGEAGDHDTDDTDETDDQAPTEDGAEDPGGVDAEALAGMAAGLGMSGVEFDIDGSVVTVRGEVPDEAARAELLTAASAQPGVTEVVDELTVAAPAGAAVDITASQDTVILAGAVSDEVLANELLTRAGTVYGEDQVDNRLTIEAAATPPVTITISGSVTDPVLHSRLGSSFDGIVGVDEVDLDEFSLEPPSEVEASLNDLDPIQFASGSSVILPESEPILDQAAELLTANPEIRIEIGGHTDSRGSDQSNQRLSQARANEVKKALEARGVANEMEARGFGESRLKEEPDDSPEAQQANRRIEFRVLG